MPVRALLSDCNTARKVARRPRELLLASKVSAERDKSSVERDEVAAEVLSIGCFTSTMTLVRAPLFRILGFVIFAIARFLNMSFWVFRSASHIHRGLP